MVFAMDRYRDVSDDRFRPIAVSFENRSSFRLLTVILFGGEPRHE